MSRAPRNKPTKKWLILQIELGKTRSEIANTCELSVASVSQQCAEYGISFLDGWSKPDDVVYGGATVVAMCTRKDAPDKYAAPGGGVISLAQALRLVVRMNRAMTGRASA